ncbi:MAG: YdeI/OmpD-associated family protein [Chitinophagaceae bacterium]
MGIKNTKVDVYIASAAPFAQPVLKHLRQLIHKACPSVEEKIKWGMPSFEYCGLLGGFASFKHHCSFGFWKAALMKDKLLMENAKSEAAMGHLGKITSLKDLPTDKKITSWIKEAMKLNEEGKKVMKKKAVTNRQVIVPAEIQTTLQKNKKALIIFESFSASAKKEYIDWITEAKTSDTKTKRLMQAIEWIAEGKPRNWKYMKAYR